MNIERVNRVKRRMNIERVKPIPIMTMIVGNVGIRLSYYHPQFQTACVVELDYENEERRTIDNVLSLD